MPRKCTICTHKKHQEIDKEILRGDSFRTIAHRFGVSMDSLKRHRKNHLPEHLLRSAEIEKIISADDLVGEVERLRREAEDVLLQAKIENDPRIRLAAIDRAGKLLDLQARLTGLLREERIQQQNIFVSPQFLILQNILLKELGPYPKARTRIVEAIQNALRNSSGA